MFPGIWLVEEMVEELVEDLEILRPNVAEDLHESSTIHQPGFASVLGS